MAELEVRRIEFYPAENAKNHRTEKFELVRDEWRSPVLRRGQTFFVSIVTDKPVKIGVDPVNVIFDFDNGEFGVELPLKPSSYSSNTVYRQTDTTLILEIFIPPNSFVGRWKCRFETANNGVVVTYPKPIYILFNPYCPRDSVYMPQQAKLHEYLQNEVGKLWKGSYKQYEGRMWDFGQFEVEVLPAVCLILDQCGKELIGDRGDPVQVARAVSAMINYTGDNGDKGVLVGRWKAPYQDGVSPWDWTGSVDILKEYLKSDGKIPVKFGQCWVFSGVSTTIFRALGIPCRSVTNFVSAHDTNSSLTVDKFFSADGEERIGGEYGYDSIWNFHVWNDVWMARPDLPPGYGGWQAVDATPQEISGGTFRCGPASVEAVRRGEIGLGFDVPFLFAEVNADVCHFVRDESSYWGFKRVKLNKYHVGRLIVTKSANLLDHDGNNDAEDITWQYKNAEGSPEERLAVFNAIRGNERAKRYYDEDFTDGNAEDVFMDLIELDRVQYGQPYKARVILENKSSEERTVEALISSSSVYYTGVTANTIKKAKGEFILRPGQKDTLALTVYPSDYMDKLVDYCMVKIYGLIRIKETNQTWSEEDDFVLEKPKLQIEIVSKSIHINRICQIRIRLKNPLPVALTDCAVRVECTALGVSKIVEKLPAGIATGATLVHTGLFAPKKAGKGSLVATFAANEMVDVTGSKPITVS